MEIKRGWLRDMLSHYGSCSKIAYLGERPVAQILFYPESVTPYIEKPREGVLHVHCVYNPFPETRGMGASSALIKSVIQEARTGLECMKGTNCSFISAEAFNTGEGLSMESFYSRNGFQKMGDELVLEISGKYVSRTPQVYLPLPDDNGRAYVLYNPNCEYSYPFAVRINDFIQTLSEGYPTEIINQWTMPAESIRLANHYLTVNGHQVRSFWAQKEAFRDEVKEYLGNGR